MTRVCSEFGVELSQSAGRVRVFGRLRSVVVQEADDLAQQHVMMLGPEQLSPILSLQPGGHRAGRQRIGGTDVGRSGGGLGNLNALQVVGDGSVGVETGVAGRTAARPGRAGTWDHVRRLRQRHGHGGGER